MIQADSGSTAIGNGTSEVKAEDSAQFIKLPDTASYPTGSLDFLIKLRKEQAQHETMEQLSLHDRRGKSSRLSLKIVIVGAGLGGLAAAIALARRGHKVTVVEQAPFLAEVGAGIQIPSNSSRLLIKWGLKPYLAAKVVTPGSIAFKRWQNGDVIALTKLVPEFQENFDAPYYVVHRAHFHDALYQLALELGVDVILNSKVNDYDENAPSVTVEDGKTYTGDLVICSDGVKSIGRSKVLDGADQPPLRTGFAAYRATVDVEKMKAHPDTAKLLSVPGLNLWIGHMRHVMTYTISGGKAFNMVLSHPDRSDPAGWVQQSPETILSQMREHFNGWDPTLTKIIDMIETTLKWPLLSGTPLKRWVASSNKLLIMGDAAHAMVPYMSQGAAMAVEDAAALAEAIDLVDNAADLPQALHLWESVRILRTSQMQEASLINGKLWHFPDGPEQRARDAATRAEVEGRQFTTSANQWSDPTTQRWCYGYDAEAEVKKAWDARVPSKTLLNGH